MWRWVIVSLVFILIVKYCAVLQLTEWFYARRTVAGLPLANVGTLEEQAIGTLDLVEAKHQYDRGAALFVDARSAEAFNGGHIPGAVRLSYHYSTSELHRVLEPYPADTDIIVYCANATCMSSYDVARRLAREFTYANVRVLSGGWPLWAEAGFPVATETDDGG